MRSSLYTTKPSSCTPGGGEWRTTMSTSAQLGLSSQQCTPGRPCVQGTGTCSHIHSHLGTCSLTYSHEMAQCPHKWPKRLTQLPGQRQATDAPMSPATHAHVAHAGLHNSATGWGVPAGGTLPRAVLAPPSTESGVALRCGPTNKPEAGRLLADSQCGDVAVPQHLHRIKGQARYEGWHWSHRVSGARGAPPNGRPCRRPQAAAW